jgi:hypothetical protein
VVVVAEVAVVAEAVEAEAVAEEDSGHAERIGRKMKRTPIRAAARVLRVVIICAVFQQAGAFAQQTPQPAQPAAQQPAAQQSAARTGPQAFDTPQQAGKALVNAASNFDEGTFIKIFGEPGADVVLTGELPQDRQRASDFAKMASEKLNAVVDPSNANRAIVYVGDEDWPFPIPLEKRADKWYFNPEAGQKEMLFRRIGDNELSAIEICLGYVDAQEEYAYQPREGYNVNQYAQRIISTPGKQDGLAWQDDDGTWDGPIGENVAKAIAQGYTADAQPYHGYYFKILKGQGPAAPLGQLNYVIEGAMIGGFALAATPAEYRVTGVKSFIVSNDGVVYEQDLGPGSLETFQKMELYNPDKNWQPVPADTTDD